MNSASDLAPIAYANFLRTILDIQRLKTVPGIYHHVRRIPYGAAGQRDPQSVYQARRGTCSGKHLLLRDLLRTAGHKAEVLCIYTHFNKGMPSHPSMPRELQELIEHQIVPDYHNVVRFFPAGSANSQLLDATWDDRMLGFGFPVNTAWAGIGDTKLAGSILRVEEISDDLIGQKIELLNHFSGQELEIRSRFLTLLTEWISRQV